MSGFWHGANWAFIIWGALNALYFIPLLITNNNRNHIETVALNTNLPSLKAVFNIIMTFSFTTLAWVFFRAENVTHALQYLLGICNSSLFSVPQLRPTYLLLLILFFLSIEWLGRRNQFALETLMTRSKRPFRITFYYLVVLLIFWFSKDEQSFIYFQF